MTVVDPIGRIRKYEPIPTIGAAVPTLSDICGITVPVTDTLMMPEMLAYPVVAVELPLMFVLAAILYVVFGAVGDETVPFLIARL